jgi:hypothetical protein
MPALVYVLSALTALGCAALLWRAYIARRTKLLMWSSVAFVGFAVNNVLLVVDRMLVLSVDLSLARAVAAFAAAAVLLYGLVWESVA